MEAQRQTLMLDHFREIKKRYFLLFVGKEECGNLFSIQLGVG